VYFNSTPDAQEMAFKATNSEYAIQCSFAETVVVLGYQWNLQYCAIYGLLHSNYWIQYSVIYEPTEYQIPATKKS